MEDTFESRIGKVASAQKEIYDFLADFRHFEKLIPKGEVTQWSADEDSCRFQVAGVGEVGLKTIEKRPYDLLKIAGDSMANIDFTLWIQIKEAAPGDSRVKLTLKAGLNPMIRMVATKPLKQFLEILISHIEKFDFQANN